MTIQDGNINKHLDEKPPKDKLFIWSIVIILVIIVILLVVLIKPEIFTNILDKFVKDDGNNPAEVVERKKEEDDEKSYISSDVVYKNISAEDADKYYKIAYHMSEYLKDQEYLFTNEALNDEYKSIWTKEIEYFPNWFTLNEEYDNRIVLKNLPENANVDEKIKFNETDYKITNKYFKEIDLKNAFYKLFPRDFTYARMDTIGYHGCYLTVYNADLEGYVVYNSVKACKGGLYNINYNLTKAEIVDDFLYLYDENITSGETYMYTLVKEEGTYKFLSRIKESASEKDEYNPIIEDEPTDETPKEEPEVEPNTEANENPAI